MTNLSLVMTNLSSKVLMLLAEVVRQCRKKGRRVITINTVANFPPRRKKVSKN